MYSSTLPLTSALDGCEWSAPRPGCFAPRKTRYLLYRKLGGPQVRSGRMRKFSPPTGIRSPDRPACSESPYRLSAPCPRWWWYQVLKILPLLRYVVMKFQQEDERIVSVQLFTGTKLLTFLRLSPTLKWNEMSPKRLTEQKRVCVHCLGGYHNY